MLSFPILLGFNPFTANADNHTAIEYCVSLHAAPRGPGTFVPKLEGDLKPPQTTPDLQRATAAALQAEEILARLQVLQQLPLCSLSGNTIISVEKWRGRLRLHFSNTGTEIHPSRKEWQDAFNLISFSRADFVQSISVQIH